MINKEHLNTRHKKDMNVPEVYHSNPSLIDTNLTRVPALGVGDTANFGIDLIPSKYRASIADTNTDTDTDTFHLKIPDHHYD